MHPHFDLPVKPVGGIPPRLTTGRRFPQGRANQISCSSSFTLGGARKLQDQAVSNPRGHDLGNSISDSRRLDCCCHLQVSGRLLFLLSGMTPRPLPVIQMTTGSCLCSDGPLKVRTLAAGHPVLRQSFRRPNVSWECLLFKVTFRRW